MPRQKSTRRIYNRDSIVLHVRVWIWGPKWKRGFDVREMPLAELAPWSVPYHPAGKTVLTFSLEEEVRERVLEEIRPGVYAQWSDPTEWASIKNCSRAGKHAAAVR